MAIVYPLIYQFLEMGVTNGEELCTMIKGGFLAIPMTG